MGIALQEFGRWMTSAFDWLTKYNSVLTLLATVSALVVAFVGMRLNARMVRETVQMRRVNTDPEIAIYLQPHEGEINLLNLIVRNIGRGPAYAVKFTVEQRPPVSKEVAEELAEIALFKGVPFIAPDQQFRYYFGSAITLLQGTMPGPIIVTANYKSKEQEALQGMFTLNIEHFKGVTRLGASPLYDIAEQTKRIAQELRSQSRPSQFESRLRLMSAVNGENTVPSPRAPDKAESTSALYWLRRWWQAARRKLLH